MNKTVKIIFILFSILGLNNGVCMGLEDLSNLEQHWNPRKKFDPLMGLPIENLEKRHTCRRAIFSHITNNAYLLERIDHEMKGIQYAGICDATCGKKLSQLPIAYPICHMTNVSPLGTPAPKKMILIKYDFDGPTSSIDNTKRLTQFVIDLLKQHNNYNQYYSSEPTFYLQDQDARYIHYSFSSNTAAEQAGEKSIELFLREDDTSCSSPISPCHPMSCNYFHTIRVPECDAFVKALQNANADPQPDQLIYLLNDDKTN